jgi:hypothetical protein
MHPVTPHMPQLQAELYRLDPVPASSLAERTLQVFAPPAGTQCIQQTTSNHSTFDKLSALFKHVLTATDQLDRLPVVQRRKTDMSALPAEHIGMQCKLEHQQTGEILWDQSTVFIRMLRPGIVKDSNRLEHEAQADITGLHEAAGLEAECPKYGISATMMGPRGAEPLAGPPPDGGNIGIIFKGTTVSLAGSKRSMTSNSLLKENKYSQAIRNQDQDCLEKLCQTIIDLKSKKNDSYNGMRVQALKQVLIFEHIETSLRKEKYIPDVSSKALLVHLLRKYAVPNFDENDLSSLRNHESLTELKNTLVNILRKTNQTDEYMGLFLAIHKMHNMTPDEQVDYLQKGAQQLDNPPLFRRQYASEMPLFNEHLILPKEYKKSKTGDALGIYIRNPDDPEQCKEALDMHTALQAVINKFHEVIPTTGSSEQQQANSRKLYFTTIEEDKFRHILDDDLIEKANSVSSR